MALSALRAMTRLLMVIVLVLPLGVAAQNPATVSSTSTQKILVNTANTDALAAVLGQGGTLLADYGTFSLWRVPTSKVSQLTASSQISIAQHDMDTVYLRDGAIDTRANTTPNVAADLQQLRTAEAQFWMIQFVGPVKDDWLKAVTKTGAELVMYMPSNAYVVWADGQAVKGLQDMAAADKFVQWAGPYHPAYRIAPNLLSAANAVKTNPTTKVTVQFYTTAATQRSLEKLLSASSAVYKAPSKVLGFTDVTVEVPTAMLKELARQADVFNVESWGAPEKLDERQGQILAGNITTSGGKVVPAGPGYLSWLASVGMPTDPAEYPIVDVVDDGLDSGNAANIIHPDFHEQGLASSPDRVAYIGNCTVDANGNAGGGGHGNLNAGIVAAFNNQSGFPYIDGPSSGISGGYNIGVGMSPYGRVAGTKIFANAGSYDISGCGDTDAGVVAASYNAGANLTSNSWGCGPPLCGPGGAYDASSQAYDALTRDASSTTPGNQQMLHVFSAGNSGPSSDTLGTPGTAKNVIAVGATENVRDEGVADGCNSTASDNADDIAGFSSRGPTDDGRTKPDVTGPGIHVTGPASQEAGFDGTGVCGASGSDNRFYPAGQTLYTWSSGTSHSAPAVAGSASLLYTYYRLNYGAGSPPSPAMLKAYLLNSTRYLNGSGTGGDLPTNNQGWGDVYLKQAFDGTARLFFDQQTTFGATGEDFVQGGQITDPSKPFRVTLTWTDAPGSTTGNAYVNDLNLEVTVGGQTYKGNVFSGAFSATGGSADTKNNVESVTIPAGVTGSFEVRVVAANIAGDGVPGNADTTDQDFALTIYNAATGPTGALTGFVRHPSSAPVAGARVAADTGPATLSNATGAYTLLLPVGTYTVTASLLGYGDSDTVTNINITENMTVTQDFTLEGGALTGVVRDAFTPSQPIVGAIVTTGLVTTTTDANGMYSFPQAPVGSVTVTASAVGYAPQSDSTTISDSMTATLDLVLPGGAVAGQVTDAINGAPIAGARVEAPGRVFTTDANGRYAFRSPPGAISLQVSKVGYATVGVNPAITNGMTVTQDVALTPEFGVDPAMLSRTFTFGDAPITDTAAMTLTNTSSQVFTYTLREVSGGFTPLRPTAGDVLLVNNDTDATTAARTALESNGYTVTTETAAVFDAEPVSSLLNYVAVVYAGNPGTNSRTKLQEYLDNNGRLLIADNDLGFSNRTTPLYTTYLDATYGGDDPGASNRALTGEDIMAGVNAPSVDPFPDYYTPGASSVTIFRYGNNSVGGSRITRNGYKAIYIATDYDSLGTAATGEPIEATIMQKAMMWLTGGAAQDNIPWLKEDPTGGPIAGNSDQNVDIGWYPDVVDQPGTYNALLRFNYTTVPTITINVPVTMTVLPSASQAGITGVVSSTGLCDMDLQPLVGATVTITATGGFSTTVQTDATGKYTYYTPGSDTYYVTVEAENHLVTTEMVAATAGSVTTQNFTLRLQSACLSVDPDSLSATLELGQQVTQTVVVSNTGATPASYQVIEASGNSSSPDASGYFWTEQRIAWVDASDGTSQNPADDGEFNVTLPFTFPFYGTMTSNIRVGNNGAIMVGATTGDVGYQNADLTLASSPNNFIAPFWDDMSSQSGEVYVKNIPTPLNQATIIQWNNRPHYNGVGSGTYQAVLYENGNILFQYLDTDFGDSGFDAGASASVGIRGTGAANASQYSFNQPAVGNNTAVCFVRPGNPSCTDIAWLMETPDQVSGQVGTPPSAQMIDVMFDASQVSQPGTYTATLVLSHDGLQNPVSFPVTMTVTLPSGSGIIEGTVMGLEACDTPGMPLSGAMVTLGTTPPQSDTTDASGYYNFVADSGTYTMTVSAAGYVSKTISVVVPDAATGTQDVELQLEAPCGDVSPTSLSSTQAPDTTMDRTLTVVNTGTAALDWSIQEQAPRPAAANSAPAVRKPVASRPDAASLRQTAPTADVLQDGGFEATNASNFTNPFWAQSSTNYGTVICNASCAGSGTVLPHTGTFFVWFGGIQAANPTEVGFVEQDVQIPVGTASLSFWLQIEAPTQRPNDYVRAKIDNTIVFTATTSDAATYADYTQVNVPIDAFADGGTHTVRFESLVETGGNSNYFLDDVMLDSQGSPCSPDALSWVSVNPTSGSVPANGSSDITVTFDSTGLAEGTYTGNLCFSSNDVLNPQVIIPVSLTVTNNPPTDGTMQGTVTSQGTPLAGATITAVGSTTLTTTTSLSGTYSMIMPAGTYTVTASMPGYAPSTQVVTMTAGDTVTVDFDLQPSATENKIFLPIVVK